MPKSPLKLLSRRTLYASLIPILIVNIGCGIHLLRIVSRQSDIKEDYAQVNSIRNGLLSLDVWKMHLQKIAATRMEHFQLTDEEEQAVREGVVKAINALIAQTDVLMQKPQKTLKGKVRRLAFAVLVDTGTLSQEAPDYAQAVINEAIKPANLAKLKKLAFSQIETAKDSTNAADDSGLKPLLDKYGATSIEAFNKSAEQRIENSNTKVHRDTSIMIASLLLFLFVWWLVRHEPDLYKPLYTMSVLFAFILLISALALPMIDIDARIQNIDFLLLGEHLQFSNQLLFYRSKSVMQMVRILIGGGSVSTVLVGVLILVFSILFPVAKLVSTLLCLNRTEKMRRQKVVHFFAYESGKWSMADVMVLAIFMAYIGFNGVLNGQLKSLNLQSQSIGVIATNQTALQAGFTLFVAFVLFGLALSTILKKIMPPRLDRPTETNIQ